MSCHIQIGILILFKYRRNGSLFSDVIDTMFNDDVGMDVEHMSSITPPSSQTWELGTFPWSNFPSVF